MRFRLVRYFTLASLGMFALVALAFFYFERQQASFIADIQRQEINFVKQVQAAFAKEQDAVALHDLVAIHEGGNITLTRLFANTMWERDFAPFMVKVAAIPVDHCRAIADVPDAQGKPAASPEKKACFSAVGEKIRSLPEFKSIDAKVADMVKKTSIYKIKVFDLRGITAYASEHAQVGEDKSSNGGWQGAMKGTPKSDLSHRDKFSAFEGVVENKDLISSYLPVYGSGTDEVIGVFEVYSDMTPMLAQLKQTSAKIAATARKNEAQMEQVAAQNLAGMENLSEKGLAIIGGLLLLLFASLFAIVRRAANIIAQQDKDRERDHQQLAQSEKMASLGQMVAGVAHQLNTPLAFSRSNISMVMDAIKEYALPLKTAYAFASTAVAVPGDTVTVKIGASRSALERIDDHSEEIGMLTQMLGDTLQGIDQMHELVENLRDFTRLDRAKIAQFDINKGLHTVAYIARSAIPNRVQVVEEYGEVPMVECNPSQLNQVFLNLINNAAQSIEGTGTITVRSSVEHGRVRVDVSDTGSGIPPEVLPKIFDNYFTTKAEGEGTGLGLTIARDIVRNHGGDIEVTTQVGKGSTFTVWLPIAGAQALPMAA